MGSLTRTTGFWSLPGKRRAPEGQKCCQPPTSFVGCAEAEIKEEAEQLFLPRIIRKGQEATYFRSSGNALVIPFRK